MSLNYFTRVVGPLDLTVTTDVSGAASGVSINTNGGGYGYVLYDTITALDGLTGTGLPSGIELVVDQVSTTGVVQGIAISISGTNGATGATILTTRPSGTETGTADVYYNHNFYELGGNIVEYPEGINAGNLSHNPAEQTTGTSSIGTTTGTSQFGKTDNYPTIKVGRIADRPQLKIQSRTIRLPGTATGTVTVYAEPTIVNGYGPNNGDGFAKVTGSVVGNTLRAEDVNDVERCIAAGYTWVTGVAITGNTSPYSYCRELLPAEYLVTTGAACPVGYKIAGTGPTGCAVMTLGDVTGGVENPTFTVQQNCEAAGFVWNYASGTCDSKIASRFSLANIDNYVVGTTGHSYPMGKVEYAKTMCRLNGYVWRKDTNVCETSNPPATKADCIAKGYTWIAGTCYNPNLFGDGQARISNEATSTKLVTPK